MTVELALLQAEKDAENAEWRGLLSFLNPLQQGVVVPTVRLAQHIIPPVTDHVIHADIVVGAAVDVLTNASKAVYGLLPHAPSPEDKAHTLVRDNANSTVRDTLEHSLSLLDAVDEFWREVPSLLLVLLGFGWNIGFDILSLSPRKALKWMRLSLNFGQLLVQTGVGEDWARALLVPRALQNAIILEKTQAALATQYERRLKAKAVHDLQQARNQQLKEEAKWYLKYSIAAYGLAMIGASQLTIQREADLDLRNTHNSFLDARLPDVDKSRPEIKRIASYLGIGVHDLLVATGWGGSPETVGHLIAVDHDRQALVVALRGTYTLSDGLVDLQAKAVPAYGGVAHQGMYALTESLWKAASHIIQEELMKFPHYRLVLTGHSLGAGVASLLNLKLHTEGVVNQRGWKVQCMGFASPPTFLEDNTRTGPLAFPDEISKQIKQALESSWSFIYGVDTIPFLSAPSIGQLASMLQAVDSVTRTYSPWKQWSIATGLQQPDEALRQSVQEASSSVSPQAGPRLQLASDSVMWMMPKAEGSDWLLCKPLKLSQLPVYLNEEMVAEHMPGVYRDGLDKLSF